MSTDGSNDCFNLLDYVPTAFNYHLLEFTPDFSFRGNTSTRDFNWWEDLNPPETENSEQFYSSPHLGISARHAFYGWRGRTEWEISSSLSGSGTLDFHPGATAKSPDYQNYSSNRTQGASAHGTFSVSAAHYFRWPFFIGAKIGPDLSGGASREQENRYIRDFLYYLLFLRKQI